MEKNEEVHVALSPWDLSDDYNRHAGATILSLMENSSTPVTAHLLYDSKLSNENDIIYTKSCYEKIAKKYDGKIIYHNVDLPDWILDIPAVKKWTPATLMRLCLPEILPELEKILYIDCDMIVTTNVYALYSIDLQDYFLGACLDTTLPQFSRNRLGYCHKNNIPTNRYFCAGTLLLNLKLLRENAFTNKVWSYFKSNKKLRFLDQDLLNWFCQGKYLEIDEKYNIYAVRNDALKYADDCIIHYAANYKPWKRYLGKIDDYYWKYLIQTPWCENNLDLIKYIRLAPDISRSLEILPEYMLDNTNITINKKVSITLKFIPKIILRILKSIRHYIYQKLISCRIL